MLILSTVSRADGRRPFGMGIPGKHVLVSDFLISRKYSRLNLNQPVFVLPKPEK